MSKDCLILVADLDAEQAIKGLLARPAALSCRPINFDLFRHPRRDPGVRLESRQFLRSFVTSHLHAIVILDRHGSGSDALSPEDIEADIEMNLQADWPGRAIAIAIDPELEAWVWSDSPEVDRNLGWQNRTPGLREWLVTEKLAVSANAKPSDPKRAYERALLQARRTRSASIFEALGKSVSTRRCADRSFVKMRETLSRWFPIAP